jgi:hypothetical protein
MIRLVFIFSISVFFSLSLTAQKELVIYKGNKMRRISLSLDDEYILEIKNRQKITGEISLLSDTTLIVNNDTVLLKDIEKIHTPTYRRGQLFIGELLFKGGIFLIIIDPINNLINNDKPYVKRIGYIGLSAIPVGYFISKFSTKKYKIRGRTHLRIVRFD